MFIKEREWKQNVKKKRKKFQFVHEISAAWAVTIATFEVREELIAAIFIKIVIIREIENKTKRDRMH